MNKKAHVESILFVVIMSLCYLFLMPGTVFALEQIVLNDKTTLYPIKPFVEVMEDPEKKITINEIISNATISSFTPRANDRLNFGYTKSAYWIKFKIENLSLDTNEMFIEVGYPLLDGIQFYSMKQDGSYNEMHEGDLNSFRSRKFFFTNFVFPVSIEAGKTRTVFIRVETTSYMNIPIAIWDKPSLQEYISYSQLIHGLYYGMLVIIVLYNFFLFVSTRDSIFIYYVLMVVSILMVSLIMSGIGFQYIWPNMPLFCDGTLFFVILGPIFGLLFARKYLGITHKERLLNSIIYICIVISIVLLLLMVFLPYQTMLVPVVANMVISQLVLLSIGIVFLLKGCRQARYFTIAWILLLIGNIINAMKNLSIIPNSFLATWSYQFGSAANVVLFSFGLADKINQLRNELVLLNENLENRVVLRTNELAHANDQLKSLDRAKTEFFANVSHELRTPLTLMLSPVASVLQGAYPGKVDETFFRKLYNNGARLLGLINNLLDFSKIEAGRMTVKAERVDVSRELELCAANFHSAAQAKGLTLSCEDRAGGVEAYVDRDLFHKAVYNLLGNAIKFTPGGGKIGVALDAADGSFTVSVADTGIGIPADKQGIIFERFGQADASSTRKYEGTGIGLSLTREIARLHGGDVTFRSVVGAGSTFYLTMPLNMEAIVGAEPHITGSEPRGEGFLGESGPQVDRKSPAEVSEPPICESLDPDAPRVLIVEDNPDMLSFLSEIVGSRYRVVRARNGKEALAAIGEAAEPFDLVLTDVMMPEMDGLELLAAVRANAAYEGVPVLLLTAKADDAMKLEGFGKGATDYIVKPFNALELLARIASQLELKEVRDRLARANAVLYKRLAERNASSATVGASAEEKVVRVLEFIAENFSADISREGLAAAVDLSPDHLSRAFNKVTGKRIDEHINELRIEEAKRRLRETDETVISIAMGVGFESVRTFNKVFAKIAGMSPTRWREGKRT